MRLTLFCFFLLSSFLGIAQKSEFDSLSAVLSDHPERDTLRANWLVDLQRYAVFENAPDMLPLLNEALDISNEIGYVPGMGFSNTGIAIYHYKRSEFEEAVKYAQRAVHVLDSAGEETHILMAYNTLGMIYDDLGHSEQAIETFESVLPILEPKGASYQLGSVYNNLGGAYALKADFAEAEYYFKKVCDLSYELNIPFGIALGESNLGSMIVQQGRWQEGLDHALKGYKIARKNGMDQNAGQSARTIGKAYTELGDYNLAKSYLDSAIKIAQSVGVPEDELRAKLLRSDVSLHLGNYQDAYLMYREWNERNDSIKSDEVTEQIEEMRARFETDQAVADKLLAELEAEQAAAESQRSRTYLILVIALALLIALIAILYINRVQAQKKAALLKAELRESQTKNRLESDLRESRMKAIRSQMNPHFIFNALNSIQGLFYKGERKEASMFMSDFAKLMRTVLEMSANAEVSIEEEQKMLSYYLDLEKLRIEGGFNYEFQIGPGIDPEKTNIPTMLLQPYVENVVKHAFQGLTDGSGKLSISINKKGEEILIAIEDNGVGLGQGEKSHHRSFSTEATDQRVRMINEGRESPVGVKLEDLSSQEGTGTRVSISIPFTA